MYKYNQLLIYPILAILSLSFTECHFLLDSCKNQLIFNQKSLYGTLVFPHYTGKSSINCILQNFSVFVIGATSQLSGEQQF